MRNCLKIQKEPGFRHYEHQSSIYGSCLNSFREQIDYRNKQKGEEIGKQSYPKKKKKMGMQNWEEWIMYFDDDKGKGEERESG